MKPVEEVALAAAEHRGIHGQDEGGAPCLFGPSHERRREAAVAEDVELEPEWPARRLAHRFDGPRRERREDHPRAGGVCGARGGEFPVSVGELLKGHRSDEHRPVELVAEEFDALRAHGNVTQDAVAQRDLVPRLARAAQEDLVARAPGEVVEHHARESLGGGGLVGVEVEQWR